jgi:Zn-dependent metalloprotease
MIVPSDVLLRLARDEDVGKDTREAFRTTAQLDHQMRLLRDQTQHFTMQAVSLLGLPLINTKPPAITVYDCSNGTSLPGALVNKPASSADVTIKTIFDTTTKVAEFFKQIFGRNSLDGAGMALQSSAHYGLDYNNAFWNGTQMAYGDGDGQIFTGFYRGDDVIAHELTHGVTQYTLQLEYQNESGGLNESLSDVFGTMFRQWLRDQTVENADWLIGADIMGSLAKEKGYTCLRDMAAPDAGHCLAPQITSFRQYVNRMDPHNSSGVPNLAFHLAAKAIGGKSWEKTGQIWYDVFANGGSQPTMTMSAFANAIRNSATALYPGEISVHDAVDEAWREVGL